MTVLMSGVNMFAMALVMKVVLGWSTYFSIWASALTVAIHVALGGQEGFCKLISKGKEIGFRFMPMFGANVAKRAHPAFSRVADAATSRIDGDQFSANWVGWDRDGHQEGTLAYMNLGVDSWRHWRIDRISEVIERCRADAYFLDIVGGWVNNPQADLHAGTRRLLEDLRAKYPHVLAWGEMHYDALLAFMPLYHVLPQSAYRQALNKYRRAFQHLSHLAPERGSTGVHEFGSRRFDPETLSLNEAQVPTLTIVDDTFDRYGGMMRRIIQRAKQRAGID